MSKTVEFPFPPPKDHLTYGSIETRRVIRLDREKCLGLWRFIQFLLCIGIACLIGYGVYVGCSNSQLVYEFSLFLAIDVAVQIFVGTQYLFNSKFYVNDKIWLFICSMIFLFCHLVIVPVFGCTTVLLNDNNLQQTLIYVFGIFQTHILAAIALVCYGLNYLRGIVYIETVAV